MSYENITTPEILKQGFVLILSEIVFIWLLFGLLALFLFSINQNGAGLISIGVGFLMSGFLLKSDD